MILNKKVKALALAALGLTGISLAICAGCLAVFHPQLDTDLLTTCFGFGFLGGFPMVGIGFYCYGVEHEREQALGIYLKEKGRVSA